MSATIRIRSEKPRRAIRHLGVEDADRPHRDRVLEHELEARRRTRPSRRRASRKPPPVKPPPSIASPTPSGGLKPSATSNGPALPGSKRHVGAQMPMPGDEELHRPELAGDVRRRPRASTCGRIRRHADLQSDGARRRAPGPSCRCGCSVTSNAALPLKRMPCRLRSIRCRAARRWRPARCRRSLRRKLSPSLGAITSLQAVQLGVRARAQTAAARHIGRETRRTRPRARCATPWDRRAASTGAWPACR